MDLGNLKSIKAASEELASKEQAIHILFNNALVPEPPTGRWGDHAEIFLQRCHASAYRDDDFGRLRLAMGHQCSRVRSMFLSLVTELTRSQGTGTSAFSSSLCSKQEQRLLLMEKPG